MSKQPGSFVLTFSRKNKDALDILNKHKDDDPNFVKNDYICDAIRFYNEYYSGDKLERKIDEVLHERLNNIEKADKNKNSKQLELQLMIKNTSENIKKSLDNLIEYVNKEII